jgi:hypothetical protein
LRTAAVNALGQVGQTQPTRVVSALVRAIKDEEAGVRRAALEALRRTDLDEASAAVKAVTSRLTDEREEPEVRSEALATLEWFGPEAARVLPDLVRVLLQGAGESVREGVARLLLAVARRDAVLDQLKAIEDAGSREQVLQTLRTIGPKARDLRQDLEGSWAAPQNAGGDGSRPRTARGAAKTNPRKPAGKVERDPQTEARDKWIYEQCCKRDLTLEAIGNRLPKENRQWQPMTKQGVSQRARDYAARHGLPAPPRRQEPST